MSSWGAVRLYSAGQSGLPASVHPRQYGYRAERIVKVCGERVESPEQRLQDKDKRRAAYHRFYTNMKWGHAQNYHICLGSRELGIEKCVDIIVKLF